MGIPTAIGVPRIIRLKETLQNSITARFTGPLVLEDPLLCGVGLAFPMRCLRGLFHEEIALLSVHKFPFPELTLVNLESKIDQV
jgi:hypothetical protein